MTKNNRTSVKQTPTRLSVRGGLKRAAVSIAVQAVGRRLAKAGPTLTAAAKNARVKAVAGAKATDKAIRNNPYKAVGVAVGAGLIAGALLTRRGRRS